MKRLPLLLSALLLTLTAIAKQNMDKKTAGSWRMTARSVNGKKVSSDGEILSFYSHGVFQRRISVPINIPGNPHDSTAISEGNWGLILEDSLAWLTLFDEENIFDRNPCSDSYEYLMLMSNDSELILFRNEKGIKDTSWYSRITELPQVHFTALIPSAKAADENLIGSWLVDSHHNAMGETDPRWQTINFFANGDYLAFHTMDIRDSATGKTRTDTITETGQWFFSHRKSILELSGRNVFHGSAYESRDDELIFYLQTFTDSSLEFYSAENNYGITTRLKRNPATGSLKMPYPYYQYGESPAAGTNASFCLVNSMDTTKRIRIKSEVSLTTSCTDDSLYSNCDAYFSGAIVACSDSGFTMKIQREDRDFTYAGGGTGSFHNYPSDQQRQYRQFAFNTQTSLTYQSPFSRSVNSFWNLTGSLSFLTAIFVAPLVSIDYRHWEFNKNRYFLVTGIGLAGIVVSVPLSACFQERSYALTKRGGFRSKHYWYLEQI